MTAAPNFSPGSKVLRAFLSAGIVFAAIACVFMTDQARRAFAASQSRLRSPGPALAATPTRPAAQASVAAPWPRFPRNTGAAPSSSVLNGVEMISEDWTTAAAADEVIDFYRTEMFQRGWQDETESQFGLSAARQSPAVLQDPRYVETHRRISSTQLALVRGEWTMRVSAAERSGQTHVQIMAAKTREMTRFATGLLAAGRGSPGAAGSGPIEHVETLGGVRYKTTVWNRPGRLEAGFRDTLATLNSNGWKPATMAPPRTGGGLFAWLTRDGRLAALTASPLPGRPGCAVAFTETDLN